MLTAIAVLAVALALAFPSAALARHSDLLLALLVLATALGISFEDLRRLREHAATVAGLSVLPLVVPPALAWALSRPFAPDIRDGLFATGLSSSDVAAVGLVGLVALARADATIALGAVTGSLIAAALIGPLAIGWLGGAAARADSLALLGRFALVVIVPLTVGIAVRSHAAVAAQLERRDQEREGVAALTVAMLVCPERGSRCASPRAGTAASCAFLAGSTVLVMLGQARAPDAARVPGAFAIAMRDFAVAAALATEAFGPGAGTVPGVYGVLMFVSGSAAASRFRPGSSSSRPAAPAPSLPPRS